MGTAFRKAYVLTRPVQAQHTKGLTWSQKWQCGDSKDFNKNSWNKMDFFLFFFLLFFSFNLNYITLNVCLKHQLRFCVYRLFQVTLDNSSASLLNFHCMKLQKVCLFLFLSFFFFSFLFFFCFKPPVWKLLSRESLLYSWSWVTSGHFFKIGVFSGTELHHCNLCIYCLFFMSWALSSCQVFLRWLLTSPLL